jgi:hypothetical protein
MVTNGFSNAIGSSLKESFLGQVEGNCFNMYMCDMQSNNKLAHSFYADELNSLMRDYFEFLFIGFSNTQKRTEIGALCMRLNRLL